MTFGRSVWNRLEKVGAGFCAWALGLALLSGATAQAAEGPDPVPIQGDAFTQVDSLLPGPSESRLASGAPGPAYWQQRVSYRIEVAIDEEHRILRGKERVRYENHSPHTLTFLWLQLDANQFSPGSDAVLSRTWTDTGELTIADYRRMLTATAFDGATRILSITDAAGAPLSYVVNKAMLKVELPQPLKSGESFEFDLAWEYSINDTSLSPGRSGYEILDDGVVLFGMSQWYPRLCAYTDYGGWRLKQHIRYGEFTLEFGDFDVQITVPADHIVTATGSLANADQVLSATIRERLAKADTSDKPVTIVTREESEEARKKKAPTETKTWNFKAQNVRDFAFASSRAYVWDAWGREVPGANGGRTRCQAIYPKEGMPLWDRYGVHSVAHAVEVYSRVTGLPYPWPHATAVLGVHTNGGMEYPMISFNAPKPEKDGSYTERVRKGLVSVIIHETGHNWFPMMINSDERHWMWLDEGLNRYVQSFAEREWKDDPENLIASPRQIVSYLTSPQHQPIMSLPDQLQNVSMGAYAKPASGLTILRETVIGRDLFDSAFREYCRRWQWKRAEPSDFFRTIEDASGMDLDWFWRGWFFSTSSSDQEVVSVTRRLPHTGDPEGEDVRQEKIRDKEPKSLTRERDKDLARRLDQHPELKDFYDEFNPHVVTEKKAKDYQKLLERLTDAEKGALKDTQLLYEVRVVNHGKMPMPLILKLEYEGGESELRRFPAEIWRVANGDLSVVLLTSRPVVSVTADPYWETADTNMTNNRFPRLIEDKDLKVTKPADNLTNPLKESIKEAERKAAAEKKPSGSGK